jgi:hypothetical protein
MSEELNKTDFYVDDDCCTSCGVPQAIAPELVGWKSTEPFLGCYWKKQPETAAEFDRAIKILHTQELDCHRYSGSDPAILSRLPAECCDYVRPDLMPKPKPHFAESGYQPNLLVPPKATWLTRFLRKLRRS